MDNLSTLFMNYLKIWLPFLVYVEQKNISPVLNSVLKKTSLTNIEKQTAFVSCDNLGIKMFLDTRKDELSNFFSVWSGEQISILFDVKEVKKSTKPPITPLIKMVTFEKIKDVKTTGLNDNFIFDNFAVSNSNNVAYSAAKAVAGNYGNVYNPLFIYGDVGVGKTHLAQAIANKTLELNGDIQVLYCTSEEFTNDLIGSIREKNTYKFRKKYRDVNVLVIDDVQFIGGKNYIQEEFYHTFNTLIKKKAQIILISDKPPKEIKKLEDRLRSRFSGGLSIDIQKPDFELRTAILLIKAQERNIKIDMEVAKTIAQQVEDTRELEGKLLELYSKMLRLDGETGIENVFTPEMVTKELFKNGQGFDRVTPQSVLKNVGAYFSITPLLIKSSVRKENIALARQIVMYILRNRLKMKYEDIGNFLKKKDHTTIMHGVEKITKLVVDDQKLRENIDRIVKNLYQ